MTAVGLRHMLWQPATAVPHDLGDPLLSTAILWWNAHVPPFTTRWWDGFAFYPAPGFMAFSDTRLGVSLIATPLQWIGCSPVVAYNTTLFAMFPLSAIAAHWLGFVLTERHDAAAIAGLSFGFCPYRIAHIPHLELQAAFGMPAALAALHRYRETRAAKWLVAFSAALALQGFLSSYYLLFFLVLLGLWLLWYARKADLPALAAIVVAGAAAGVTQLPVAMGYSRIHAYYGLERTYEEILGFSADLTSYLTAHSTSWLWGWTSRWAKSEGELFPGAIVMVLAAIGIARAWRQPAAARDLLDRWSVGLLVIAAAYAALAYVGWAYGPWHYELAGISVSSNAPFKPVTVACAALAVWVAISSRFRGAHARRSALAFYGVATLVLIVCSLGPRPTVAGHQFLYEPPYAWLMRLSVFSQIRVPARFGLVVVLTLGVTAAVAFDRLRLAPPTRRVVAAVLMLGIIADGWIADLAMPRVPDFWETSRASGFAAVLELPLGDLSIDFPAMYRATSHQHPVVNGSSGFEPTHYFTLRTALKERDRTALDGFPEAGRLLIAVDKQDDKSLDWDRFLIGSPRITRLPPDDRWTFYAMEPPPPEPPACGGTPVPVTSARDNRGPTDLAVLTDGNPKTFWATPHTQRAGDSLVFELGRKANPCAIVLEVGEYRISYPRKLLVETSVDGVAWTVVADRRTAGLTMRAALTDPRRVAMPISLAPSEAKFVRLRLDESHPEVPWQITEVSVLSQP